MFIRNAEPSTNRPRQIQLCQSARPQIRPIVARYARVVESISEGPGASTRGARRAQGGTACSVDRALLASAPHEGSRDAELGENRCHSGLVLVPVLLHLAGLSRRASADQR